MPENDLLQPRRTIELDPAEIAPPERAAFVELGLASCFSFLRGASDAVDLVLTARALGYDAIGIADVNSMAGVVRLHTEADAPRRNEKQLASPSSTNAARSGGAISPGSSSIVRRGWRRSFSGTLHPTNTRHPTKVATFVLTMF